MRNYQKVSGVQHGIPLPLTAHPDLSSYSFHSHLLFLIPFNGTIYLELWLAWQLRATETVGSAVSQALAGAG